MSTQTDPRLSGRAESDTSGPSEGRDPRDAHRAGSGVRATRAIEFSSSLRYRLPGLSDAENRERFGRQADQHGHNYRLEVTLRGEPDPATGMVINLVDLKELLEREVMSRFDHRDLNADTSYFDKVPPTPEHLASVIAELLRSALPAGMLDRVRLYRDEDFFVDVLEDPT